MLETGTVLVIILLVLSLLTFYKNFSPKIEVLKNTHSVTWVLHYTLSDKFGGKTRHTKILLNYER